MRSFYKQVWFRQVRGCHMLSFMRKFALTGIAIAAIFQMVSCSSGGNDAEIDDIASLEGAEAASQYIQDAIPAIEASLSVMKVENTSTSLAKPSVLKTIGPWNDPTLPATPELLYTTYYDAGTGYARYPASGYLQDFYDVEGNLAFLEMRAVTDGWGDYQVSLYVIPSLSPSVNYTLEKYRVYGVDTGEFTAWSCLVGLSGACDPIAFEELATSYFDGRMESRTMTWSRYVDDKVYAASYFDMPTDFADAAYTYSATPTEPSKLDATSGEYASKTTFTIPAEAGCVTPSTEVCPVYPSSKYCSTTSGTEFYDQLNHSGGGLDRYSKAYSTEVFQMQDGTSSTANTVRIYSIDPNSVKNIRGKTVTTYGWKGKSWNTTTTEVIRIHDDDGDSLANYVSTVDTVPAENYVYWKAHPTDAVKVEMVLEETAINSNTFAGTMTVTRTTGIRTYNIQINPTQGLVLLPNDPGTPVAEITFPTTLVEHSGAPTETRNITLTMSGGTFVGTIRGGIVSGTFTDTEGNSRAVVCGVGFAVVDYEAQGAIVSKWRMDEGQGTKACDSVGPNNGTLSSGVTWTTTAEIGTALNFDGTNNAYVTIPDDRSMDLSTFSIALWLQPTSVNKTRTVFGKVMSNGRSNYELIQSNAEFTLKWQDAGGASKSVATNNKYKMKNGTWYHVVVTGANSSNGVKFYLNGVLVDTKNNAVNAKANTDVAKMGSGSANYLLYGITDEMALYNRALTTTEVKAIYDATALNR